MRSGGTTKALFAMPPEFAVEAVEGGIGNPNAMKYLRDSPGSRFGKARSFALDQETLRLEANRGGVKVGWKVVEADYMPEAMGDYIIAPSVRNPSGGIVIHHTNLDNLNSVFKNVTIIGDLNL